MQHVVHGHATGAEIRKHLCGGRPKRITQVDLLELIGTKGSDWAFTEKPIIEQCSTHLEPGVLDPHGRQMTHLPCCFGASSCFAKEDPDRGHLLGSVGDVSASAEIG